MTKQEQQYCQQLISKYYQLKRNKNKQKVRNELYFQLKEPLTIWVYSILKKWHISQTEQEVISLTWHCYLHALEKYTNRKIPLPYHFYTYSMYYLYQEFIIKNRELIVENNTINSNNYDLSIKELFNRLPLRPRQILVDILTSKSTNKTKGNYYKHKKQLKEELKRLYS
jgi:hypothetical protein